MKKPTFKRLGLGLIQQLAAMCIMISVAGILFNSYLTVESMNGKQTYSLSPMDTEPEFEDSRTFYEIFKTAVSDITRLVIIKGQVETEGEFDPYKQIDVTQYANRLGQGNTCDITAVYQLEDLIKWGKYGVEYTNRSMSMSEFVNYFGPAVSVANFALDGNGNLYFAGFLDDAFIPDIQKSSMEFVITQDKHSVADEKNMSVSSMVEQQMQLYTEEQLEDMALSYIMREAPEGISVSREDDGSYTVYFPLINCRYDTVDGEKQLLSYAANWVDYANLQKNLADTIDSLTIAYEQYQNCNHLYLEGKSNLKYVVRMIAEDGIMYTYTNVSEMEEAEESTITDFFAEYRRYLIYYPDSLEFTGNTNMTEEEIYGFLNEYNYAHPEATYIWIGIDTDYAIAGDIFYNANAVFQRIVPNIEYIITLCVLLGMLWVGLGIYLTVTDGVAYTEEGEIIHYLNGPDHIWTEVVIVVSAILGYGAYLGYLELLKTADAVYLSHSELYGGNVGGYYEYSQFAAYGFLVSMIINMLWYSLVRRVKSKNLWRDSFCYWVLDGCRRGITFIFSHKNTVVSTLLPYNLFLLINLSGILFGYILYGSGSQGTGVLIILCLVVIDSVVGVMLFKHRAEQIDIVEGIKKIRDGEVDYKLEVNSLHGDNREMADAVNNIGEGIRNAVKTSMKDEQMKTDLITNVSHDIKTPLTSIINYLDLLKRLKIKEEPARSYINVLDAKSQRLKQLTDDLVEASKISSGNIVLNNEKLNLTELLNQAIGEFSEKLEESKLTIVFNGSHLQGNIYADSRRMWRIIENLFNNICKYAMEGTRVYLDITVEDGYVQMSLKNISATQMNIQAEELTERFIRGDSSRTTEGSGLGLFIAKSLTKAQGGEFAIGLDGDLFKTILRFAEYVEQEEPSVSEEEEEK